MKRDEVLKRYINRDEKSVVRLLRAEKSAIDFYKRREKPRTDRSKLETMIKKREVVGVR